MKKIPFVRQSERGQSLVEMAVSLMLILTLLSGAVDIGRAFFIMIALNDAAQEGALYGSIGAVIDQNGNGKYDVGEPVNTAAIVNRVRQSSNTVDLTDTVRVGVDVATGTPPCAGAGITIRVTYQFDFAMPLIATIIGHNTVPIRATMTNTILRPACP
jgi:Flp pilus assembly protein TadG